VFWTVETVAGETSDAAPRRVLSLNSQLNPRVSEVSAVYRESIEPYMIAGAADLIMDFRTVFVHHAGGCVLGDSYLFDF